MKKTVLCLLLSLLLLPFRGFAESSESTEFDLRSLAEDTVFLANLDDPEHAILGLERNADKKRYPASTTKIMTCIIALEQCDPDEIVTVSKRAVNLSEKNSKMGIQQGETWRMIDLLYGLMLPSGNDAAIAIAEHIGGSIDGFAELMNRKADSLGMHDTHYKNPHGLHNGDHYTTARDLAKIAAYAMENETFREIVSTPEYTVHSLEGRKIVLRSANRLLRDATAETYQPYSCLYENAIGIKTGSTHLAGKCLVAAARKNDTTYLLVLLHGETAPDNAKGRARDKYSVRRFNDAIDLFEYAFEHDTVTVDVNDLLARGLPESYVDFPDPNESLAQEALYRIEWDTTDTLTLPRWIADGFLKDPFPEDQVRYTVDSYRVPVGEPAGTVTVDMDGRTVFKGTLIVDEYTYPPTPEPTAAPTFRLVEETAGPTPFINTPSPVPPLIPLATEPPRRTGEWFFRLFRCSKD